VQREETVRSLGGGAADSDGVAGDGGSGGAAEEHEAREPATEGGEPAAKEVPAPGRRASRHLAHSTVRARRTCPEGVAPTLFANALIVQEDN
jgi:hypothetical protein